MSNSSTTLSLHAGSYTYQAQFIGNGPFAEVTATSEIELLTVNKASLQITTAIHDANHNVVTEVPLGSVVHDTATVTGGVAGFALPAVSFTLNGNSGRQRSG